MSEYKEGHYVVTCEKKKIIYGISILGDYPKMLRLYSVIQKGGLNFVRLYFLNYTWYVNDLHNIWKRRS